MKRLLFTLTILSTFSLFATAQTKYEAEAAQRSNCDVVSGSQYSGGKAVKMTESNATLSFTIPIDKRGKYNISVAGDGIGGGKVVNCTVNGSTTTFQLNTYEEVKLGTFILKEGNNTVVRRLKRIMNIADLLFILSGILMVDTAYNFLLPLFRSAGSAGYYNYIEYVYNKWVILLLIAGVLEVYSTHRMSSEMRSEK